MVFLWQNFLWLERTISGPSSGAQEPVSTLNVIFIVAFALIITVLAKRLSGRNNRKK